MVPHSLIPTNRRAALAASALALALAAFGCGKGAAPGSGPAGAPPVVVSKSGVEMVSLPGGKFTMGADQGNPDEAPAHEVTVSPFLMDRTPVTHAMFAKAQLPDPSHWQDDPSGPVERIRWRDAKAYCNERSRLEGLTPCYDEKTPNWDCNLAVGGYRLPTEAEWEYAARAGSGQAYSFGAREQLAQYGWFADNAEKKTHPVGRKKPNAWGLHEMYGNVSVWCEDVYDPATYKSSPAKDPTGPAATEKDPKRVLRGGNWKATADMCRASFRQGERTGDTDACFATDFVGMRCVRRATADEVAKLARPKTRG
ncbi:MAG: SUMF1/EgtB/PvdO family nonheme iron enzyme [Armatimonadetes bacterium]|nr:SUMF1/EgtB/PvdO family nonheme iron enzyme [Armatimonadota bacterium]